MFISRNGASLNAIYGVDSQGKPQTVAKSSPQGVVLSDGQKQMISNSKFFEAGASMSLLSHPGQIGDVFDRHAQEMATLLRHGLSEKSVAGSTPVYFKGQRTSLSAVLQDAFNPLLAKTDQVGRQMTTDQPFQSWLLETLSTPLRDGPEGLGSQSHVELLSKIRASSALGTTIWQLMNPAEDRQHPERYALHREANANACVALLSEAGLQAQADEFMDRINEFSSKTRTPCFDNPLSRARSERMPMLNVNGGLQPVNGVYEDAATLGLGFGLIVQNTVDPASAEQAALRAALGERNQNINAIAREGAPIEDLTRPFTMSETDMENIPAAYTQQGMSGMLAEYAMLHGTGINRWQTFGTFSMESNLQGLPSAGAQSGSTCDILLALNTLNPERIYGNPQLALPAGLGIAAFMNFGGYHTFAETFPIAEAVAANRPYVPTHLAAVNQPDLYQRIERAAERISPQGAKPLAQFRQSHAQVQEVLRQQYPGVEESQASGVDFHATEDQIKAWRS